MSEKAIQKQVQKNMVQKEENTCENDGDWETPSPLYSQFSFAIVYIGDALRTQTPAACRLQLLCTGPSVSGGDEVVQQGGRGLKAVSVQTSWNPGTKLWRNLMLPGALLCMWVEGWRAGIGLGIGLWLLTNQNLK